MVGCGQACPGADLDLRGYVGGAITETVIACSGDGVAILDTCIATSEARFVVPIAPDDCHEFAIELGPSVFGTLLQLRFDPEGDVAARATAVLVDYCDEECVPPSLAPMAGHVSIEALSSSRTERNSGAFRVELDDDGVIEGTYLVDD
jgi:hypothetical protein